MSGGKGGSQSSQVQIPAYMEDALKQQIARAQAVQSMPYAPIMGPTMAGFTGGQRAGLESQAALAQRMGIISPEYDVASGYMPGAMDVGNGLTAYASYPGAKERVIAAFAENPELERQFKGLYAPQPTYQETMAGIAADRAAANAPRGTLDVISGGPEGAAIGSNPSYDMGYIEGVMPTLARGAQSFPSTLGAVADFAMGQRGYDYNPTTGDYEQSGYMGGGSEGYSTMGQDVTKQDGRASTNKDDDVFF
mgnify:CR=1 FL=1